MNNWQQMAVFFVAMAVTGAYYGVKSKPDRFAVPENT